MRARHPRLITVDISGYGDFGPYKDRRAYDLLVQAEAAVKAAANNVNGASAQVANLAAHLASAESHDLLAKLIPHATVLADKLLETIGRMKSLHAQLGHSRPEWKPSAELIAAIRFLEFNASGARR